MEQVLNASATSVLVAPIVGGYLCVSAIGLLRKGEAASFLTDICTRPSAMHGVGAIAFFAGTTVLSLHRHWETPAEIAINVVALSWLIEGAGLLADPARLRTTLATINAAANLRKVQALNLVLGLYLIVAGVIRSLG